MVYAVSARLRAGKARELLEALETGRLAAGEVYEEEMQRALNEALVEKGVVRWVETCYCPTPLEAERSVLESYFEEIWTEQLEGEPRQEGQPLPDYLRAAL